MRESFQPSTRWTVTIERDGKEEATVKVVERETADHTPAFGDDVDLTLAIAVGQALRAHALHDESPWLLATVACLLEYLATWNRGPEWDALHNAARGVFAMLDRDTAGDLKPGEFESWANRVGEFNTERTK